MSSNASVVAVLGSRVTFHPRITKIQTNQTEDEKDFLIRPALLRCYCAHASAKNPGRTQFDSVSLEGIWNCALLTGSAAAADPQTTRWAAGSVLERIHSLSCSEGPLSSGGQRSSGASLPSPRLQLLVLTSFLHPAVWVKGIPFPKGQGQENQEEQGRETHTS